MKCFVERTTTADAVDPDLAAAYLDEVDFDNLPDDEIDRVVDDARQNGWLSVLVDFLDSWVGQAQWEWASAEPHLLLVAHGECFHYTAMRYATGVLVSCDPLRPIPTRRKLKRSLDAARAALKKMSYYDFEAMVTRMNGELLRAQAALQPQVRPNEDGRNEVEETCDQLGSVQRREIFRYLHGQSHSVSFDALRQERKCFRSTTITDGGVLQALKRLRTDLEALYEPGGFELQIRETELRCRLNRPDK